MDDRSVVALQIGRTPRAYLGVAVRCPFGAPAVTLQDPYDASGNPFPTTYYLTCRHLVAAVSRLEAAGGVERWTDRLAHDLALRSDHRRATGEQRALRRRLAGGRTGADGGRSLATGIGGSRSPGRLKCLHAHAAYALAHPGYLLGEAILREVQAADGSPWPPRCCVAYASPS